MDKLSMHSADIVDENIEKIGKLFPNAITEREVDGKVKLGIDFDVLKQELSKEIVDGPQERYQFTWPDKKKSILLANIPTTKTLRLEREKSVGRDGKSGGVDSENIYIEGNNLEALKILRETYLGKVKMIYIDPPYNTGNDRIYKDDYFQKVAGYTGHSGQTDEEGNRLVQNTESNGRFHTDWLNMMYPRLKLAKDLLAENGVMFISIDDRELDNLRKVCAEIFGETNFVADLTVVNNLKGRNDKKYIARANERLLMYVKSDKFIEHGLPLGNNVLKDYSLEDKRGKYRLLELRKRGGADLRKDRPNMYYPFFVHEKTGEVSLKQDNYYNQIAFPIKSNGDEGRWRWGIDNAEKRLSELYGKKVGDKFNIYEKDYLEGDDGARRIRPKSVLSGAAYSTDVSTKEYRAIMGKVDFSNPKSITLLSDLIIYATSPDENAIVMDFFSGSATTAHATIRSNIEENGNRRYIMVQIPEKIAPSEDAYSAGYRTICDIAEERIRKSGQLEMKNSCKTNVDYGFRCFKVDSSNMKNVYYSPGELMQKTLDLAIDNIKPDRTPEDLLFQVMLDLGILLSSKIEKKVLAGKKVFSVADGYLLACFDEKVTEEVVTAIAKQHPYYAVFRDSSMADSSVAANFEQIFKTYSPNTVRKVL